MQIGYYKMQIVYCKIEIGQSTIHVALKSYEIYNKQILNNFKFRKNGKKKNRGTNFTEVWRFI